MTNRVPLKRHRSGSVMVLVVLCMTLLAMIIPFFISMIQKEARASQGETGRTKSFQLAEAGADRGAWKLRESDAIWALAIAGTPLTNYNDDKEFTDVQGGKYKVRFQSGPGIGQVTVWSKGRSDKTLQVRTIK